LARWNVNVAQDIIVDPKKSNNGQDVVVYAFTQHPVTKSIIGSGLHTDLPRPISRIKPPSQTTPDEIRVTELAYSSSDSFLRGSPNMVRPYPMVVAIEKNTAKGVVSERGASRILVVGDTITFA